MSDHAEPPPPLEETDRSLERALRGFHRLRWAVLGVLAAVLTIAIVVGGTIIYHQGDQLAQQRQLLEQEAKQLAAGCNFFTDLAALPVDPVPPVKRPSRALVTIVVDSRDTARGLGCPDLAPPTSSLRKWSGYYHIPVH